MTFFGIVCFVVSLGRQVSEFYIYIYCLVAIYWLFLKVAIAKLTRRFIEKYKFRDYFKFWGIDRNSRRGGGDVFREGRGGWSVNCDLVNLKLTLSAILQMLFVFNKLKTWNSSFLKSKISYDPILRKRVSARAW